MSDNQIKAVLEIQTVPLGRVEKVGVRMLGWSDTKAAAETLLRWIWLTGEPLQSHPGGVHLHYDCMQEFARTIIGWPCKEFGHFELGELVDWLKRHLQRTLVGDGHHAMDVDPNNDMDLDIDLESFLSRMSNFPVLPRVVSRRIELVTEGRVFFVSETGATGLAPASTRPGDTVHILPSGPFPFVLRVDGSSKAELIGDCYLHTDEDTDEDTDEIFVNHISDEEGAVLEGSLPYEMLYPTCQEGSFGKIQTVTMY